MIPYFQDLGDRIAAAWDRDARALPALAMGELERSPAPAHTSLDALLRWVCTVPESRFTRQRDLGSTFGEPPLTVYQGPGFCIDVNLWATSSTQIHEHAFAGAFQVLHGSSLHSRYTFEEARRVRPDLAIGALHFAGASRLEPGDAVPIAPGAGLVHSLFHLHHPTATVVVRTLGEPSYLPQRSFDPPGLAYDGHFQERFTPLARRQLQIVHFLASADAEGGTERLAEICAEADPMLVYLLFADVLPAYWAQGPASLSSLDQAVASAFGGVRFADAELGEALCAAARRRLNHRLLLGQRRALTALEDREIAGALLCAPDRAAVEALLGAWHPEVAPLDQLLAFVARRGEGRDALGFEAEGRAALAALLRGEEAGPEALAREIRELSLFAAWFRA